MKFSLATGLRWLPTLALLVPGAVGAQDVPSMLARVEVDGRPAQGIAIDVYADGTRRELARTGRSGLAVIEFSRAPLPDDARLRVFAVTCGEDTRIAMARSVADLPVLGEDCVREGLGTVLWTRTERLDIALGDRARADVRLARDAARAGAGFRVQAGPVASLLTGDFDDVNPGVGGEVLAGYDTGGGWGVGGGGGFARHDLDGLDEVLWRWSATLEPRYTFVNPASNTRPFLVVRVSRQSLDFEEGSRLLTETGWSFGGGGGVSFPLFRRVRADLSAHAAYLTVDAEGFDRSGLALDMGAALRF